MIDTEFSFTMHQLIKVAVTIRFTVTKGNGIFLIVRIILKVLPNGKCIIYLEMVKAIYGCLKSARLSWGHLSNHLSKMVYTQNNYDLCVANKKINNSN